MIAKRRRILERFDKKLADTGCKKEDMFALEAALKVKLVAVDALGNTLWDSGKYKTHTKVVVPCHNNHTWAEIPTDPPKIQHVHFLDNQAEKALKEVINSFNNKVKDGERKQRPPRRHWTRRHGKSWWRSQLGPSLRPPGSGFVVIP